MSKLIKYSTLSLILAGNETSISQNRCPKKYLTKVNELKELLNDWENKNTT